MKKIAFAIEKFSRYAGGAESYAVSLASTLIKNGWEVHLFGETWDGEPKEAHFHEIHIPKFLPAWIKLLLFAWKHRKLIQQQHFDIVMGFGNTIYMNVYQSHGGVHKLSTARKVYSEKNPLLRMIKRILVLLSLKRWTRAWIEAAPFRLDPKPKIIAISPMIKKDMESFFDTNANEIEIIHNGVDTKRYNRSLRERVRGPLRNQWGVSENDMIFLFVSYELKKKGIEPLVEAAAELKRTGNDNFKIIVAGGLPYYSLVKLIEHLGLKNHIIFTGRVKSIDEFYANSDVFVLPTYYDACSLVLIEAMATGLPSITTTLNGASSIITNGGNGYVISHPPDSSELADKMLLLMDNKKLREMSEEAFRTGQEYSDEKNHLEMMRVLHEATTLKNMLKTSSSNDIKKIAVIIPKYGLLGGAEQFVAEMTNRLADQTEFDLHVLANRWQTLSAKTKFHGIPIISFPKFLTTLSFAYFVQRYINNNNFSLVHSHERIFAADIFTMHGIPHRYWVHNIRRKHMSLYDLATAWVEKELVYNGNCKKFIAVSSLTKDIFLQEYKINPDKVAVINPGVDLCDYERHNKSSVRNDIRRELGINLTDPVVIFASMNFEIKGLDDVLFSLAKLKAQNKKFKLIVAGKGNIKKYTKMAQEVKMHSDVIFTGPVNKEKIIKMYLAGDIYIMLSKFDTFGMVVLEAMAAGLPAIISSNVGAKDLVQENKNGFIIDNTSDTDYIAAKIALLLDENIRREMSSYALQTAAQNTWDDVTKKYATIYESILEEKRS